MFSGEKYVKVSGGDAADSSWEAMRIRGMGLSPRIREDGSDYYSIYLKPGEAEIYARETISEEKAYWASPKGIEEQKTLGQAEKAYLRSPEGRLDKHQEKLWRRSKPGPRDYYESDYPPMIG